MSVRLAALAMAALVAVGCVTERASPPPVADLPVACVDLEAERCERAVELLRERSAGLPVSYVIVARRSCDGPCPGEERGAWLGRLIVEFDDGRAPAILLLQVAGDEVAWEPLEIEGFLVRVEPSSGRVAGPVTQVMLGHCGLSSPIDVDGSLWDPVGMIDQGHPDLINSARATFSLTSPLAATLRTDGGAVVPLVRHAGPRHYPACD